LRYVNERHTVKIHSFLEQQWRRSVFRLILTTQGMVVPRGKDERSLVRQAAMRSYATFVLYLLLVGRGRPTPAGRGSPTAVLFQTPVECKG